MNTPGGVAKKALKIEGKGLVKEKRGVARVRTQKVL